MGSFIEVLKTIGNYCSELWIAIELNEDAEETIKKNSFKSPATNAIKPAYSMDGAQITFNLYAEG